MDVATLVRAVSAAFDDAGKLVKRIRKDREARDEPLPDDQTQDLLDSLALGPAIIRGHYDHDLKRFGEQYACGDGKAREQMKDVLINLQMTLIIALRSIMMDEMDFDFNALQSASDDGRVNAGVCLGQLSQRLSPALQAQSYYPPSPVSSLAPPMSPALSYSSNRSTLVPGSAPYRIPRSLDPNLDALSKMSISPPMRPNLAGRKTSGSSAGSQDPYPRPSKGLPLPRLNADYVGRPVVQAGAGLKLDEKDRLSMRRRSSQALATDDNILMLFPTPERQPVVPPQPNRKDSSNELSAVNINLTSSPDISRASSGHRRHTSRDRFGPDDYDDDQHLLGPDGRQYSHGTIYDMYQPPTPERHPSHRAQPVAHNTLDHVRYLQDNARAPRPQPRSDSLYRQPLSIFPPQDQPRRPIAIPIRANTGTPPPPMDMRQNQSRPHPSAPIAVVPPPMNEYPAALPMPRGLPPLPPMPNQSNVSKQISPMPTVRGSVTSGTESIRTTHSSLSGPVVAVASGQLTLPTDKDHLGFCRGAFRLQIGLEAKAFKLANRPAGYSGMISTWRCEKCVFEGPVHNTSVLVEGKKKPSYKPVKLFDPKVRISETQGIRYKWAFLAKSHVVMKGTVPFDTALGKSGAWGSFGCIFCAAEGKQRGWLDKVPTGGEAASIAGSGASTRSWNTSNSSGRKSDIKNGGATGNSTPIFGNVGSFLAHLETVHRPEDGWPNAEMQGRMKLVVGRTAPADEDGWDINFVPL